MPLVQSALARTVCYAAQTVVGCVLPATRNRSNRRRGTPAIDLIAASFGHCHDAPRARLRDARGEAGRQEAEQMKTADVFNRFVALVLDRLSDEFPDEVRILELAELEPTLDREGLETFAASSTFQFATAS
jgi:hypothetical protein